MRKLLSYSAGILVLAAVIAIAVLAGWKIADHKNYQQANAYPLLDPSVVQSNVHQEIINFDPLRQNLKQYLINLNLSHSLYFEYLPNGANIRNGADNQSEAASLLKVPIVMDLYRLSELGQINIDQQVTVKQSDISTDSDYGDPTHLQAGNTLTLRQAAQITLQYSDNTTLQVIKDQVLPLLSDSTDSVQSLDIAYGTIGNNPGTEQVTISAMSYSSVLKCLYYACFNTPQDSTQILDYLSNSVEHGRLMAGVPAGIRVAHKVGSSLVSQSDCGIIYDPGKPYLVCLMFFNLPSSVTNIDQYFQSVSQMIYNYVNTSGSSS
jgi:beta-lactamase class A